MYTATSKQIMGPVADAISELIMLNFDADANDTIMPDLSEFAGVVDSQAVNLVNVVNSTVSTGDAQLQFDMPPACRKSL